jgi:tetratricopeptide (TPR) repeat protein
MSGSAFRHHRWRLVLLWAGCAVLSVVCSHSARGDEPLSAEQKMAAGLRGRLLYDLADLYCDDRLSRKDLSPVDQANLIVEKIQTQVARAVQTPTSERAVAWQKARELGDEFLQANPNQPRRLIVRVQQGLAALFEARLALQELAVQAGPIEGRDRALERLRAARTDFDNILREIGEQLPTAPDKRDDSGTLTNLQLQALKANVEFQIGTCHLLRGKLYDDSKQVDRLDAFSSAAKSFENVLKLTDAEGQLWYSVQLEQVEASRLLGDRAEAVRRLNSLELEKVPANLRPAYWEQRLELAAVEEEIKPLLEQVIRLTERSPQLDLAGLRAALRVAGMASDRDKNQCLNAAADWTKQIETRYGGYWGRLAELTLVGATGNRSTGPTQPEMAPVAANDSNAGAIEILIRTGDNAAREKRNDDALLAYRKAIAAAQESEQTDAVWRSVLQAYLKVGRLLEERQAYREAAKELMSGVSILPQHELAPWLQLQAAWCMAQVAAVSPEALPEYRQLLEQHLQNYAAAATANQALLWLARLDASARNYRQAADRYLQIEPTSEQALPAANELQIVALAHLRELAAQPDRAQSEARSLGDAMVAKLSAATGGKFIAGAPATRALLLATASIGLQFELVSAEKLAQWLSASLEGVPAEDPWRETASAYLAAALAGDENQRGRALELLSGIKQVKTLETALQLLDSIAARKPVANPARLAAVEKLLQLAGSDSTNQTELRLRQAAIWEAAGELDRAIETLEALAKELPRRLDVQLRLARALAKKPQKQAEALAQWRKVSAGVRDRSEEWYEAKYQVASLLLESGQKSEAKKLLDYLSVVPPGWSDSKLKQQFDALYERCK